MRPDGRGYWDGQWVPIMNDASNLTIDKLQDAFRAVRNAATLWYGTITPPFVIVHPDDVSLLGPDARHLREYRPTQAEIDVQLEALRKELITHFDEAAKDQWVFRLYPRWGP